MQVNSINSLSNNHFGNRDELNAFINLEDGTLKQMAYADAMSHVNKKKYKRQNAVLDLALPLAGGLSTAAFAQKGSRLSAFGKGTAGWGLFLLGIGAVFGAENALRKHSEKFDNFVEKHGFLTFATSVAGAYVAGKYAVKGGTKLGKMISETGIYKSGIEKADKLIKSAKNIEVVKRVTEKAGRWISQTPPALKEVAKTVASWAPIAVIIGQIAHSANYTNSISKKYYENYDYLKQAQLDTARQYNKELELACDCLGG